MNFIKYTLKAVLFVLFFTCAAFSQSFAKNAKLNFVGTKTVNGDTLLNMNLLYDFNWDVINIKSNNATEQFLNCKPDKLGLDSVEATVLQTTFIIDTALIKKIFSLGYAFKGSVKILLNNHAILATGVFATNANENDLSNRWQRNYVDFIFTDTLNHFMVEFIPFSEFKKFDIDLRIGHTQWAEKRRADRIEDAKESVALGVFYLSFAIVFCLLFIFFRTSKENLYFAMFCFFAAFSFLFGEAYELDFANNFSNFSIAIAIEFLSIFFALVLINKEKTKIPLLIICLVSIIFSHPTLFYRFDLGQGFTVSILLFLLLVVYTGFSALYFLVQGFGQKKWEAKTITLGSLIGLFFNIIAPGILTLTFSQTAATNSNFNSWMSYLADIGLCIYPLTVAIVLGRRNALNQTQLINQVKAIEKLSVENVEKEKEKKKLLEEQNFFLETKVEERTRELAIKNEVISVKNREITDSLVYAKRIQSAILPDIKLIYKALEQSFILYLPKDIVSGDFYGFAQKDGKVIIAAADCTGHGVAGAFMSMIGSSLLNAIINERHITEPAKILDELNEGVIHSLKQRESESNDGMDISICAFDLKNRRVEFAGANRPLWLIRNGELITYKPNKFPIGGLQVMRDEKFNSNEIALKKNDSLYLFSDGFADQFGGEKGKKLMTKKFKDTLLAMQSLTMYEQELRLKELFDSWKGTNEQVDDVLVIGIKI